VVSWTSSLVALQIPSRLGTMTSGDCTFTYRPGAIVSTSRFLCRPHGVAVDLDGVVRAQRVALGERDRYRDSRVRRMLKDQLVPPAQALERESQTAELVELVRIRS